MNSTENVKAMLMALAGFACFVIGDSFLKQTTSYYETEFSGFIIISLEMAMLLAIAPWIGGYSAIWKTKKLKLNIFRGFMGASVWFLFIISIQYLDLTFTYSILLSAPFWTAIAAAFIFRNKISTYRLVSIILGFLGVLVVLQPGVNGFSVASLLPLFAALCFAAMAISTRFLGEKEPLINLAFYILIFNLLYTLGMTGIHDSWALPTLSHIPFFIVSAFAYLIGILLTNRAFAIGHTVAVVPTQYSQIVWGTLIGFFFFAETPDLWTILGALLIVGSGIYLVYNENKTGKT